MNTQTDVAASGLFEPRHVAFLETITHLRPRLHRYCARMTGSALDGEDVMQEAVFEAYRKPTVSMTAVRSAHGCSGSHIIAASISCAGVRSGRVRKRRPPKSDFGVQPTDPLGPALDRAVERLVLNLPPKERACVLLKDVFDYSLEGIAELVNSTVGGVKAALNRGRAKLAAAHKLPKPKSSPSPETLALLHAYVDRFNRRDWDGVRELTSADAKLRVADCFVGRLINSPYFVEYERPIIPWRMALGEVDGETVVIIMRKDADGLTPFSAIRLDVAAGRVARITDYIKCAWVLDAASVAASA